MKQVKRKSEKKTLDGEIRSQLAKEIRESVTKLIYAISSNDGKAAAFCLSKIVENSKLLEV